MGIHWSNGHFSPLASADRDADADEDAVTTADIEHIAAEARADIEAEARESPQDPASLSLVAEAIGLSFSTEDYAGSVAGLVAKVAKLHADNFSLRAEAALAKSAPPSSLRDGMDRLFDAIGSKDVGECISRLQSWGDERARQRQTIKAMEDGIMNQAATIALMRDEMDALKRRLERKKKARAKKR